MDNKRTKLLANAIDLINGPRQASYGPPEENFERIAVRWSQHLGIEVTAYQVCLCMAELKLARLANGYSQDSLMDGAAYLALADEVHDVV